jgi:hypothetical protein
MYLWYSELLHTLATPKSSIAPRQVRMLGVKPFVSRVFFLGITPIYRIS